MENNENQYCPNCGHKVSSADEFCPNCGQKLTEESNTSPNNEQKHSSNLKNTTSGIPKKPMTKRTKISLGAVLVVGAILIGGYLFGNHYYSREATATRIIDGIKNEKTSQVESNSYTNDPSYKIDKSSFKSMFRYFKTNKYALARLQRQFNTEGNHFVSNNLTLEQHGNAWLIFPKYEMNIKPVYTSVSTNISKPDVKVDGKKSNVNNKKIGPLTPGEYNVDVSGKLDGKKVSGSRQLDCIDGATSIYMHLDSGVASKSAAKNLANEVFDSLSVSTVKDGSYADYFDNGTKNDFYKQILGMVKSWDKSHDISSFNVKDVSVKSVKPGSKNKTKVIVDVTYEFDQRNGDEKTQTMEYSLDLVKNTAENNNTTDFVIKDEFAKGKVISEDTDTSGHIDDSSSSDSSDSNSDSDSSSDSNSNNDSDNSTTTNDDSDDN